MIPPEPQLPNRDTPTQASMRRLKKLYTVLIVGGLLLGGIASIGIVALLNHLGLTPQSNRPQRETTSLSTPELAASRALKVDPG